MNHNMRLMNRPFESIKNGTKTIEIRLFDDKRKSIKSGDTITFTNLDTNEILKVLVIKNHVFASFEELYKNFNKISLGYEENEEPSPDDMNSIYSDEEQNKYGLVGIEIKLIN